MSFLSTSAITPGSHGPVSTLSGAGENLQDHSPIAAAGVDYDTRTGDTNIDALLIGTRWDSTELLFTFPTDTSYYTRPYEVQPGEFDEDFFFSFFTFDEAWQSAARSVLGLYEDVSGLTFVEVQPLTQADVVFAQSFHRGTEAISYPGNPNAGHQWYNPNSFETLPDPGTFAWHSLLRKTGYSLGLANGHTAETITDVPGVAMEADRDSMEFSVMTSRSYVGSNLLGFDNETYGFAQSLMMYDIAAIQHLYGANHSHNDGDTTYTFSETTGEMFIDGVGQGAPGANRLFLTVWDGDGVDTYDFSNYASNLDVNLAPGSWSVTADNQRANLGTAPMDGAQYARGNVFNALLHEGDERSLIENAIGGSGDDTLLGNQAGNELTGGAGADRLAGLAGDDVLNGGSGNDVLYGDSGFGLIGSGIGIYTSTGDRHGSRAAAYEFTDDFALFWDHAIKDSETVPHATMHFATATQVSAQFYKVYLSAGSLLDIDIDGANGIDTNMALYDDTGNLLAESDGDNGDWSASANDSAIWDYTVTSNGYFYIVVGGDFQRDTIPAGASYTLNVSVEQDLPEETTGNDTLRGGAGNDVMYGGGGDDTIYTDGGHDRIDAGDGNDTIYYGISGTVNGVAGKGMDIGGAGIDTLIVQTGSVAFRTSWLNWYGIERFFGHNGNDRVIGRENGVDYVLFGGNGDDELGGAGGNDELNGGNGSDVISGGGGDDRIDAGAGNDILDGGAGNDVLVGGAGADRISGGAGNDTIHYDNADIVNSAEGRALDIGGEGFDTLVVSAGSSFRTSWLNWYGIEQFEGHDGNDRAIGRENGVDYILNGGGGDDFLGGAGGNDRIAGGAGNDEIHGGNGHDRLAGDNGNDRLFGGNGNDLLEGGADHDRLAGGNGDDVLLGGDGNDLLFGNGGRDTLRGGAGNDHIWFGAGDVIADGDGVVDIGGSGYDTLNIEAGAVFRTSWLNWFGIERFYGNAGDDRVIGRDNTVNHHLDGGGGNDRLAGAAGADFIAGGAGDNILTGGGGADTFHFHDDGSRDLVTDFEDGIDRISIDVAGVDSLADVAVADDGLDTVLTFGGAVVRLENVDHSLIDGADFLFV